VAFSADSKSAPSHVPHRGIRNYETIQPKGDNRLHQVLMQGDALPRGVRSKPLRLRQQDSAERGRTSHHCPGRERVQDSIVRIVS